MIDKNAFDGSLQTRGAFFRRARYDLVQDQISDAARRLLDPATGELPPALLAERVCVVCGSSRRRTLFVKNRFPHVKCEGCGFVYVNPILREDTLIEYYSAIEGSWTEVVENEEYNAFQKRYYDFHIDNIERIAGRAPGGAILDIGCNSGEFLVAARLRGWRPAGHELNRHAVARARQKGIEVLDRRFSAGLFGERRFGAVTLWGVLEHLPHPGALLDEARKLLEPGGVLALLVPNIDSIATRVLRERCNTFDGIEHLNFWNRATLERFLAQHEFRLQHAETAISELYTLNNYLHYEDPYASPEDYPLLLDALTPEYIHAHYLGHHLCAYACL